MKDRRGSWICSWGLTGTERTDYVDAAAWARKFVFLLYESSFEVQWLVSKKWQCIWKVASTEVLASCNRPSKDLSHLKRANIIDSSHNGTGFLAVSLGRRLLMTRNDIFHKAARQKQCGKANSPDCLLSHGLSLQWNEWYKLVEMKRKKKSVTKRLVKWTVIHQMACAMQRQKRSSSCPQVVVDFFSIGICISLAPIPSSRWFDTAY